MRKLIFLLLCLVCFMAMSGCSDTYRDLTDSTDTVIEDLVEIKDTFIDSLIETTNGCMGRNGFNSILLMLAIGLPIILLVWRKFSINSCAGQILPYEFPWLQMGAYVAVVVTVELILSVWTIRRPKKQSLIEQMRAME